MYSLSQKSFSLTCIYRVFKLDMTYFEVQNGQLKLTSMFKKGSSTFGRLGHLSCIKNFFKKVTLAGLSSLWHQDCQILVKIWISDDPIQKKGPVMVILVPGWDGIIKIRDLFEKKGLWKWLRPLRLLRLLRAMRL